MHLRRPTSATAPSTPQRSQRQSLPPSQLSEGVGPVLTGGRLRCVLPLSPAAAARLAAHPLLHAFRPASPRAGQPLCCPLSC